MKTKQVVIISLCIVCCLGWSLSVMAAAKSDPLVEKAQKRLAELGYDVGAPDGKAGPKTIEAIKKFQQDQGLTVTGKLDEETLKKLELSGIEEPPKEQPQEQKSKSKSWVVTDVTTSIENKIPGLQNVEVTPNKGMKVLEVIGTFSKKDDIQQPTKVDEVFVTKEKTSTKVTGVGLMSGGQCKYEFPERIIRGSVGFETPSGGYQFERKEKTDPMTFVLKKNPSQLCFSFIVPEELKGNLSFHFVDLVIPISIK
jgi:hypothetical protein